MSDAREGLSLTALALETSNNERSHLNILSEREPKTTGALEAIKITQRRVEHRPFRHCLTKKNGSSCVLPTVQRTLTAPNKVQRSMLCMPLAGSFCIMQNANCALVRYSHNIGLAMRLWAVGKRYQNSCTTIMYHCVSLRILHFVSARVRCVN